MTDGNFGVTDMSNLILIDKLPVHPNMLWEFDRKKPHPTGFSYKLPCQWEVCLVTSFLAPLSQTSSYHRFLSDIRQQIKHKKPHARKSKRTQIGCR